MRVYNFKLDSGETIAVKPPKLRQYNNLLAAKSDSEAIKAIADIIGRDIDYVYDNFTTDDAKRFLYSFPAWIQETKQSDPN